MDPSGLEFNNIIQIIAGLPNTQVYGYIDSSSIYSNILYSIDTWASAGVKGIFCDNFGYENGLTREVQNDLVDYIHSKN